MIPTVRLLVIFLLLTMLAPALASDQAASVKEPHSVAAERKAEKKRGATGDHKAGGTIDIHIQKSRQKKSAAEVRTEPHDSEIDLDRPPDVFDSPEAKSADHIPKPLPSDEVRPPAQKPSPRKKTKIEHAWEQYNNRRYQTAADMFADAIKLNPDQAGLWREVYHIQRTETVTPNFYDESVEPVQRKTFTIEL